MIDSLLYARHWSYVSVFLMRIDAYWRIELLYGRVSFHNLGRVLIKELVSMLCQDGVSVPRRAGDVGKADLLEPSLRDKSLAYSKHFSDGDFELHLTDTEAGYI